MGEQDWLFGTHNGTHVAGLTKVRPAVLSVPTPRLGCMALTETESAMLELERLWWQFAGAKESRIREVTGLSSTRYYQELNRLIDREDAMAADPLVVKRLRRLRDQRQRSRSAARLGLTPNA